MDLTIIGNLNNNKCNIKMNGMIILRINKINNKINLALQLVTDLELWTISKRKTIEREKRGIKRRASL